MRRRLALLPLSTLLLGVPACDAQEGQTVGPRGGVITSPDGRVTLDIPVGALTREIVVHIDEVDDGPDGALGGIYEITPRLTMLRFPAELTIDLESDPEQRTLPLADMADAVTIVTEGADGWSPLPDLEVDTEARIATASVLYFSSYAVVP